MNLYQEAKCLLFDLDGTLVDSMPYWRALTVRQARARYAHLPSYSAELETALTVLPYPQARARIAETLGIPLETITTDRDYTRGMMRLFYRHAIGEKKEACRILREAHAHGVKTALLTATRENVMGEALDRLDLRAHFDLILTPDDYPEGKWGTAIFEGAMNSLGVRPEETVLFEDAYYSMRVAYGLGIRSVPVDDRLNFYDLEAIRTLAGEPVCLGGDKGDVTEEELLFYEAMFGRSCRTDV